MEIDKRPGISSLKTYADHELLELTAMKEDAETSGLAFNEFHRRFKDILYKALERVCPLYSRMDQKSLIDIVFSNTIINAYDYAGSFKTIGETDPEIIRKKIIGWLLAIAKQELRDQLAGKGEPDRQEEEKIYGIMLKNASGRKAETYNEQMFQKALEQIPKERDREIFYTYWLYYEKTPKGQAKKLPDDIAAGLAAKYETTPVNIRQIIVRTNKLVFAFMQQNYKK